MELVISNENRDKGVERAFKANEAWDKVRGICQQEIGGVAVDGYAEALRELLSESRKVEKLIGRYVRGSEDLWPFVEAIPDVKDSYSI